MRHQLRTEQFVPRPRSEVAPFFEDPRNLERITPPFLEFRIDTKGDIPMRVGTLIEYTIRMNGLPMGWTSRIDEYIPGERFVDLQLVGPYKYWHHLHTFADAPGGTLLTDQVTYELPLGPLGAVAHTMFVKQRLRRIFDYRQQVIAELFGEAKEHEPRSSVRFDAQSPRTSAIV